MIPYVEFLTKSYLKAYAQVEPSECWFEISYYEVGQCEIYAVANKHNLSAMQKGVFCRIPNRRFIWYITSITYTYNVNGTRMIVAKGYEAKYLLTKRIIMDPLELPLNLGEAVYKLVYDNLSTGAINARRIVNFNVLSQTISITMEPTQATRTNLLEYVNNLLKTYHCGSYISYENNLITYQIIVGQDRTASVVFSQSQDNLLSSEFYTSDDNKKTYAMVVSKVNDIEYIQNKNTSNSGIDRNEMLVSSDLSLEYTDINGQTQTTTPTSDLYKSWQINEGEKALAENTTEITTKGEIDLVNSRYKFDEDFFLGDIILIKDEYFNFSSHARVTKVTFKQQAIYGEEIEFKEE